MEEAVSLASYRLTFAQAVKLVKEGKKEPVKIFYVVNRSGVFELAEWIFDDKTFISKDEIIDVNYLSKSHDWRFFISAYGWVNPPCDGGFLNYFHAWGWKLLQEAKKRKRQEAA